MGSSETGPKGIIFPWKFPATENLEGVHDFRKNFWKSIYTKGAKPIRHSSKRAEQPKGKAVVAGAAKAVPVPLSCFKRNIRSLYVES